MQIKRLAAAGAALALLGAATPRPADWAQPVALEGAPNLHRVTDTLYRSAQPTAPGMENLRALGIRTVVNLRAFHSDRGTTGAAGLLDEELSVKTWHLEDEDVVRVLRIVKDPAGAPYLIHCLHGADRTGTMVALYRMVIQGWSRERAIDELVNGGFGFHSVWRNVLAYLERVDVDRIRAAVDR
jgi:protein tyrosine/serine phosphatase